MELVRVVPKRSNVAFRLMASKIVRRVMGLFLLAGLLGLLASCTGTKAASPPPSAVPVVAATVEQKDIPQQLRAIGVGEPYSTAAVKTQGTGEHTGAFLKEGQDVKKRHLLFNQEKRPRA